MVNHLLSWLTDTYQHEEFLAEVATSSADHAAESSYMYRWLHLDANDTAAQTRMNRMLYDFSCAPGVVGAAGTTASPNDPIFWTVHGLFERALSVLTSAPRYAQRYNFTWAGAGCGGSEWKDELPFRHLFDVADDDLDDGGELSPDASGANLITNSELWDILKPGSEARPYIYDQFTTWGELQWDPFSTQEDYSGPRVVPSTPFQDQQGHSPTRKEHHS